MDFELDDTHKDLRASIRAFVDREIRPVAHDWERSGRYPTEIVATMRELGLFGMTVPEEFGGQAFDLVAFSIVFEEISRAWMGIAGIIGSHSLACWIIAHHGTEDQKRKYLPQLATGERRTGIALTEPAAGSDLQGIQTRAVLDGDHYIVNGTKTWITNARHANPLPVLVKTDASATPAHRGMSLLLVESDSAGFVVSRDLGKLGYKGPESCEVSLQDVRVPAANLLGGVEGRGLQQSLSGLEIGRINVASRAVGVAAEALDQSLAYAKLRHAFGHPIADFQAIQLKLADMATEVNAARLLTWWAASVADTGTRADTQTGMAKLFASEVALKASLESMRIHGSYGYSTELDIERLYRDAPLMAIGEGTNDILRTVIAKRLLEQAPSAG